MMQSKEKRRERISVLPDIQATDSVCTGWRAKTRAETRDKIKFLLKRKQNKPRRRDTNPCKITLLK
jgi:hypothetical protein